MSHPTIDSATLAKVLGHYPGLGALKGITRNGLSVNTATCLFESTQGTYFAKAYDPLQREPAGILAEHSIVWRLLEAGFPTPRLKVNRGETTLTWHAGLGYVLSEVARGEDRYGHLGVFDPFGSPREAHSAGATLARFHLALATGAPLAPKPFRGLTARYELMAAPSIRSGLDELLPQAPGLLEFLAGRSDWPSLTGFLEERRAALSEPLYALPRGLIHGDFIKRNLFWQGHEVSDVIDFDLWNVGYWVYDLALALLPCGFDWPELLKGQGAPRFPDLLAFLEGYQSVRALSSAETTALPRVMETARVEFYLGAIATMLQRGDPQAASRFYDLLIGTTRWFQAHPDWEQDFL